MGTISVKVGSGEYTVTTASDNTVSDVVKAPGSGNVPIDPALLKDMLQGVELDATRTWTLDNILASIAKTDNTGKSGAEKDSVLAKRLNDLSNAISTMEKLPAAQKAKIQDALNMAKAAAKAIMADLQSRSSLGGDAAAALNNAQTTLSGSAPAGNAKAQMTTGGGAQPQGQAQAAQAQTAPQQQAAAQQPGVFPGGGKAAGLPGQGQPFDLQAMLQSSLMQTANTATLDQLGKTQMDQKKMMMLFMYFAMMAMSGDMGAMTAFMQFITTIITKDKAQLNIQMANKLIELEDANRKAVKLLMDTPSYDPNNPQVGADFTKVMEKVKAEEGSIATSQKLIAQMMEDFSQVSEFLNNLQKSMLDVRGRLLSRLSSFNA